MIRRAFTLIELLVVIAIIAILAAILFPVFAQAKEAAKSTTCISNCQGISTAVQLYATDFDDQIVPWELLHRRTNATIPSVNAPIDDQIANAWTGLMQPYMKNYGILFCPSYSISNTEKAMDNAFCDGNGAPGSGSAGFLPADVTNDYTHTQNIRDGVLSDYGLSWNLWGSVQFQDATDHCDGNIADPYAHYPGNGYHNTYGGSGASARETGFTNNSTTSVTEPARTAIVGDAVIVVEDPAVFATDHRLGTAFGCEGQFRHKGVGANYGFLDTHSQYLPNNPERFLLKDSNGCLFEKFFTMDR